MKKQTKCHTVETTLNMKAVKRGYSNTASTQIMAAHFHILVQALQ